MRVIVLGLVVSLFSCNSPTGSDGGADAGGETDAGTTTFRAFTLNLARTPLSPSCFRDTVPPNPELPARTIEVLTWTTPSGQQFIALDEVGDYTLGDAPLIRMPEAAEWESNGFVTLRHEQRPITDQYTEVRQTLVRVIFDDLNATSTRGQLALSAQFACIKGRADCPVLSAAPSDAVTCQAVVPFTAQSIPLGAKWTTPDAPVAGSTRYLVTSDLAPLASIADPACFRNGMLPPAKPTLTLQKVRALDVWQVFTDGSTTFLRAGDRTWKLADAPTISFTADLPGAGSAFSLTTTSTSSDGGVTESRSTYVSISGLTGNESQPRIDLQSSYSCAPMQTACPLGDGSPQDAATCSASLTKVNAVQLP